MSAILGRLELDRQPIDGPLFLSRFERLRPYGPDSSESWIEGPCAVGRHLLRIAPAAKHERLLGPANGVVVVADAILDNREELAGALGFSSAQISMMSDTELIRLSFLRWGKDCVQHLVGDFAFAAIRPGNNEVFLACDHIGSRPLFWSLRRDTLIFSTAIEGIVCFDEWKWPIDDRVVAEHLLDPMNSISKPFFRDIRAVPAGAFLLLRGGSATTETWWRPSTKPTLGLKSPADVAAACRTLLERAVADRINTDGRIGAHISGGIDSTGVAVIAARALRRAGLSLTRAYSWSPPVSSQHPADHKRDERGPIQHLAQTEEIPIQFGSADDANLVEFIDRSMEMEGDADLADEVPVLRAAGEDALLVMISGWGGDEAFSAHGSGYLASLALAGRLGKFKAFAHSYSRSLRSPKVLFPLLWRGVIYPLLPDFLYHRLSPYRSYIRHGSFISNKLRRSHADLVRKLQPGIKFGPNPNKNLKTHITAGHVTMRMRSWAAWSSHYGFQYRYPLTDRRLLEFVFTLPPEQLFMNDQPRGLARAVLADCIPTSASKTDIANERLRRNARAAAWRSIAQAVDGGFYDDDCPWLDMKAFRAHALAPADQNEGKNILAFGEVYTAARIWSLYQRATANGWL